MAGINIPTGTGRHRAATELVSFLRVSRRQSVLLRPQADRTAVLTYLFPVTVEETSKQRGGLLPRSQVDAVLKESRETGGSGPSEAEIAEVGPGSQGWGGRVGLQSLRCFCQSQAGYCAHV